MSLIYVLFFSNELTIWTWLLCSRFNLNNLLLLPIDLLYRSKGSGLGIGELKLLVKELLRPDRIISRGSWLLLARRFIRNVGRFSYILFFGYKVIGLYFGIKSGCTTLFRYSFRLIIFNYIILHISYPILKLNITRK